MNILITGANSPFGRYAAKYLKSNTNFKIYGTVSKHKSIPFYDYIYEYDLLGHNHSFYEGPEFDYIFHLASAVPAKYSNKDDFLRINVNGSLELFSRIKLTRNSIILNASSLSVYGSDCQGKITEESTKTENSFYGISKLIFENKLNDLLKDNDCTIISARIPVLIVPNVENNFVAKWKKSILLGHQINISNPDDIFNAIVDGKSIIEFVLNERFNNQKFSINVAADEKLTFREVARLMYKTVGIMENYKVIESQKPNQIISTIQAESFGFVVPKIENIIEDFMRA